MQTSLMEWTIFFERHVIKAILVSICMVLSDACNGQSFSSKYFPTYRIHIATPCWVINESDHVYKDFPKEIFHSSMGEWQGEIDLASFVMLEMDARNIEKDTSFVNNVYKKIITDDSCQRRKLKGITKGLTFFTSKSIEYTLHERIIIHDINLHFNYIYNCKAFQLVFTCREEDLEKYKPIFLQIAESVYFY